MTVAGSLGPFVGRVAELEALRAESAVPRSGVLCRSGRARPGSVNRCWSEHLLADESELIVLRATGEPWELFVSVKTVLFHQTTCSKSGQFARRTHRAVP